VTARPALDVSRLPAYAFGPRGLLWWGTMGIVAIEGMMFAIFLATYFYLRIYVPKWPPNLPPPDLLYGTLNTLICWEAPCRINGSSMPLSGKTCVRCASVS
jgi:cytochrome c oxidase subunit III